MRNIAITALLGALIFSACPTPMNQSAAAPRGKSALPNFDGKRASLPGKVVAKVGDVTLTVGDLQKKLDAQTAFTQAKLKTPEDVKKWVDQQIKWEVLAQEAFRRGYHQDPEAIEQVKKLVVQRLSREQYEGAVKVKDIDQASMQQYFRDHEEEYNKPEMVRLSAIKIAKRNDPAAAKKAAEKAHGIASNPETIDDRTIFKKLVRQYSSDQESRAREGDTLYLSVADMKARYGEPGLKAIMATTKLNEVASLVEREDAYWIFKRTGRRKPIVRTFDDVRSQIRNKMFRDKKAKVFDEWVQGLKKSLNTTLDESALSELVPHGAKGIDSPRAASAPKTP